MMTPASVLFFTRLSWEKRGFSSSPSLHYFYCSYLHPSLLNGVYPLYMKMSELSPCFLAKKACFKKWGWRSSYLASSNLIDLGEEAEPRLERFLFLFFFSFFYVACPSPRTRGNKFMSCLSMEQNSLPCHVHIFSLPAQGHVNSILKLA